MRDVLTHRYFGVDPQIVWGVVEKDLAPLEVAVTALLDEVPDDDEA
jgi:uncharacterized protein with HEPN domain